MMVLSVGMDKDILKRGSVSFARHQAYAKHVDELHAVVFARKEYGKDPIQIAPNAWAYPTHAKNIFELFFNAYRIALHILKKKGHWVLSAQDPFESGLVVYVLSKTTRIPFLIQEHGDFFSLPYWKSESFANNVRFYFGVWLIRRATHLRVVSVRIANTFQKLGVPKNKITVVPVYTDIQTFQNAKPDTSLSSLRSDDEVLILTMGRFVPQKNLTMLLRSFVTLRKRGVNAKLVILGKGPDEKSLRTLASCAPDGSVVFKNWTDSPASLLRSADMYALSSNYEGWGRVCIEALAVGVPLLMTDVGCAGEVVKDNVNGLVVPVNDEWAFTEGLCTMATNTPLRERLVKEGLATIKKLPTFEDNVLLYISSLEVCLKTKETEIVKR
jgi:glycosyltransferase involved in cell wall biosynthesis